MTPAISVEAAAKSFTMHLQGGVVLPVVAGVAFEVFPGECVALGGPSGAGKSSLLKMIYGNYRTDSGAVRVWTDSGPVDIGAAAPREILRMRKGSVGYVSQFLRVVPRVAAQDIVAEPALQRGVAPDVARVQAKDLLARLNIPERLWALPPATFSGGEQQRVNIARGFIAALPILLLDEPTASLDAANRNVVVALIEEKKAAGTAILGIFHDDDVRERVADRVIDVTRFSRAA
jgi:alpha-D-ribose 1-methylphosphonate 5-triphosphate synthase subunit PhnL